MGILATVPFTVQSTYHRTKVKHSRPADFVQENIIPINNVYDWRYIHQRKQTKIENMRKAKTLIELIRIAEREIDS